MAEARKLYLASISAHVLVALAALLVYINTLPATFTFDDNFAVITNGDVTNDAMPLADIFRHDFWGQDIRSHMSHKSYRPVTVLSFRWTRQAWMAALRAFPGLERLASAASSQGTDAEQPLPSGLIPFPYHMANVLLHALASVLVLALARHLFMRLEQLRDIPARMLQAEAKQEAATAATAAAVAAGKPAAAQAAQQQPDEQQGLRRRRAVQAKAAGTANGSSHKTAELIHDSVRAAAVHQHGVNESRVMLQAFVAALLFALHPIHTEAVSGIVGHAELLCASLSIPSLLLYFSAVNSAAKVEQQHGATELQQYSLLHHWLLVAAAVLLAWAAALSKEIGITVIGAMALYDVLLGQQQQQRQQQRQQRQQQTTKESVRRTSRMGGVNMQLCRLIVVGCAGLAYVKLRSWLAGDHLVRIYRKVENPIPFANSMATRIMSTGYLHAKYAHLLWYPKHLSADWSFACIPLVESWMDSRNAATVLLYAYLLAVCIQARPLALAKALLPAWTLAGRDGSSSGSSSSKMGGSSISGAKQDVTTSVARWRLLVVAGLVVGPFFPAANVLFYVGTFIGERLLYFPSIGFCLLLAEMAGRLLFVRDGATDKEEQHEQHVQQQHVQRHQQQQQQQQQQADAHSNAAVQQVLHNPWLLLRRGATVALLAWLLGFYAWRTVERNRDWLSEEALFTSALRVCPESAKVRLNAGILARRQQDFDLAVEHFRHAQVVEPGYCEPTYWLGITRINQGAAKEGMALLVDALSCKYVAAEALKALNKIYGMLMEGSPNDPLVMLEWGKLLASPHVGRAGDACTVLEDAALLAAQQRRPAATIDTILQPCLAALDSRAAEKQQEAEANAASPISYDPVLEMMPAQALADCVRARQRVYQALAQHGRASHKVRSRMYAYIRSLEQAPLCRRTASVGEGSGTGGVAATQQKLVNRIQSTDAEDPWLQLEWARSLLAPGLQRAQEASIHLQVAAALFSQVVQAERQTKGHTGTSGASIKARSLLHPGKALGADEAAAGAIQALEFLASLPGVEAAQRCSALQNECQLRVWVAGRLQQRLADTASKGGVVEQSSMEQAAAAQERGRACLAALQASVHCADVL